MQGHRRNSQREQFTNLIQSQQQLLDSLRAVDLKLQCIGEVVGANFTSSNFSSKTSRGPAYERPSSNAPLLDGDSDSREEDDLASSSPRQRASTEDLAFQQRDLQMRPRMSSPSTPGSPLQQQGRSYWSRGNVTVHPKEPKKHKKRHVLAWNPDSRSRTFFDVVGVPLLLCDAFIVPYLLAWDTPLPGLFVDMLVWCTRLFWTADLFVNMFTGYRDKDAKLVLHLRAAMHHYLRGWFFPDLTLVGLDWISVFLHADREFVRRWMRVMRLVRTVRQLLRGWTLALKAKLMIPSKTFHLIMELSILILIIVWVNHVVCCGWYTIGGFESDTGTTWRSMDEYDLSEGYAYWTALHWAMTQMTPGSMEVTPKSSGERIYNISILMLGLLMGTSLVAMMTSMLTQYKLRVESSSQKFMLLHKFLTQQGIEHNLALAIKMHVKARSSERQRLRAQDVEYLSLLSNAMQDRLWCSWCQQHLFKHQLISSLVMVDDLAIRQVCKDAIQHHEFGAGDLIFEVGAVGEDMHFLAFGQLRYHPKEDTSEFALLQQEDEVDTGIFLDRGSWCSEAALWTMWVHMGTLEAASSAEVLSLSAPRFTAAIANFPVANEVVGDYAVAFCRHINDPGVVRTDLSHVVDNCELLSSLSPETRWSLAEPVMENLERHHLHGFPFMGKANFDLLKQEVSVGKCDIRLIDGEVVRTTSIVAVRLHRTAYTRASSRRSSASQDADASRFLVRVGERNKLTQEVKESFVLPGVKRGWRESYLTCCDRVVEEELEELKGDVTVLFQEGSTSSVLLKESPTYGIRTRYLRTTFDAHLSSSTRLRSLAASTQTLVPTRQSFVTSLMPLESRRLHKEQHEVMDILRTRTSLVVLSSKKNPDVENLYSWLNEHEFDMLSKDTAKPLVKQWLNNIRSHRSSARSSGVFYQSSIKSEWEDESPVVEPGDGTLASPRCVSTGNTRAEQATIRQVESRNCEL